MKRTDWPVKKFSVRPAGKPAQCFYCKAPLGSQHIPKCNIRQRTVVIELRMDLVVDVPEDWDNDQIKFFFNGEGSNCQSNLLDNITDLRERMDQAPPDVGRHCFCGIIDTQYVREATTEDEDDQHFHVNDLPS